MSALAAHVDQQSVCSDEDSEVRSEDMSESVQLGLLEPMPPVSQPLFLHPHWGSWDGGKVGGKPVCMLLLACYLL